MLTKQQFQQKLTEGYCILDGATGSNLRNAATSATALMRAMRWARGSLSRRWMRPSRRM